MLCSYVLEGLNRNFELLMTLFNIAFIEYTISEVRRVIKFISALKWIILVTRSEHWFSVSIKHRPKTRVYGILLLRNPSLGRVYSCIKSSQ